MINKMPRVNEKDKYDLFITDAHDNSFMMTVGGNLDLYWIPENHKENRVFEICKEDEFTFGVFDKLYDAIRKNDDKYNPVLDSNTITFISEDWPECEANILNIIKSEDVFTIEFIKNENREEWSFPHRGCNICFCNSGSRVPKVESLFMRMFTYLAYECDLVECGDFETDIIM